MSHEEHLRRGYFLREAGALQRTNADGPRRLERIAFPTPDGAEVSTGGRTVALPTTTARDELHAALGPGAGWAPPAPEVLTSPPATAPPLLVYADLLTDLGEHLFLLTDYPADVGRPDLAEARLEDVRLTIDATTEVELTVRGITRRVRIALDSGVPLDVVPLLIAEHLLADESSTEWRIPRHGGTPSAPTRGGSGSR
ncbi:hypothetical protein ACIQWA_33195 [Kitasatospora sp. NPDC098652]|uniref:hypothetical protein n=1 Tax=Kitasatospora sp. NPDC098652 TaxID=3364095 RepID=UPI003822FF29